jgi:hypothetical protein
VPAKMSGCLSKQINRTALCAEGLLQFEENFSALQLPMLE